MKLLEKLKNYMMKNMSNEQKEKMMKNMSKDKKEKMMKNMMENFGKGSDDNKGGMQEMMQSMMSGKRDKDMKGMMGKMKNMPMNEHMKSSNFDLLNSPIEMRKRMIENFSNTNDLAAYATPELRLMFDEWLDEVQQEIIHIVEGKKITSAKEIATILKLSEKSVSFLLGKLAQENKLNLEAKSTSKV